MSRSPAWDQQPAERSDELIAVMCRWVFRARDERARDLAGIARDLGASEDEVLDLLAEARSRGIVE